NVTPDSFSDGGLFFSPSSAVDHALSMVACGADIIDVGGESTRPGSEPIWVEEELLRIVPVIRALSGRIDIPISIDTYKSEVARVALQEGAQIVNDVSALRFDRNMAEVAAKSDAAVVLMHMQGTPRSMQKSPYYVDLVTEVKEYLAQSVEMARNAGISDDRIIVDPGLGFGKTFAHNLEIIRRLGELRDLGKAILVGPSRKAFIGKYLGDVPADQRLEGTAAAVAISIFNGANIVRVHDVREMSKVVRVADAILRGRT
ncbi:MAG: dihydropteroate synthase, partial [Thermodesulfovibrionales bacterium]